MIVFSLSSYRVNIFIYSPAILSKLTRRDDWKWVYRVSGMLSAKSEVRGGSRYRNRGVVRRVPSPGIYPMTRSLMHLSSRTSVVAFPSGCCVETLQGTLRRRSCCREVSPGHRRGAYATWCVRVSPRKIRCPTITAASCRSLRPTGPRALPHSRLTLPPDDPSYQGRFLRVLMATAVQLRLRRSGVSRVLAILIISCCQIVFLYSFLNGSFGNFASKWRVNLDRNLRLFLTSRKDKLDFWNRLEFSIFSWEKGS